MIDVKDFRIGNKVWIKCSDGEHTMESIIKNDGFTGGYCFIMENGNKVGLDYLVPIPLTEELLLKYGFKEYDSTDLVRYGIRNDDYRIVITMVTKEDYFYVNIFSLETRVNVVDQKISYLHQLQNLVFHICGIEINTNEQVKA